MKYFYNVLIILILLITTSFNIPDKKENEIGHVKVFFNYQTKVLHTKYWIDTTLIPHPCYIYKIIHDEFIEVCGTPDEVTNPNEPRKI